MVNVWVLLPHKLWQVAELLGITDETKPWSGQSARSSGR